MLAVVAKRRNPVRKYHDQLRFANVHDRILGLEIADAGASELPIGVVPTGYGGLTNERDETGIDTVVRKNSYVVILCPTHRYRYTKRFCAGLAGRQPANARHSAPRA